MGHLSLSCFGCMKFSGFQVTKTSANKRLLLCLWTILVRMEGWHTRPHSPAWIISTAKVMNYFGLSKKRVIFGWFLFRNWWVNFFRNRVNLFRKRVNFFRKRILRKVLWGKQGVEAEFCRSSLGRRSVFSRWNKGRYKRGKRDGNLNKKHFLMIWSSLVVSWFFFGFSLVFYTEHIYKE